ncbi:NAD-dependent epimerase/dehydratase family protein [Microbacterium sp. VKM Ac-2870]|uniref:NAD-dependent epimerase/dehydratase family protein n=1 Tax=Microbacterium sp. VKM Ac-2870 TaxID=2783825 RepID=UPI00188A2839|nr:NAD-dependent epimerase/dehydratase family protein [Microbacterium sp. VKM Ac-2870]MBF4561662.1 NAD-dependent epimerase/dehydratase family protein [Microbacterium sp. VKM Ac-2870]
MNRWIIGRGLLGNAVARARPDEPFRIDIPWSDSAEASRSLHAGLSRFLAQTTGPVEIYWCAGKSVTSTPREQLDREVGVFRDFVSSLSDVSAGDRERVTFFLASSVGGAYAHSTRPPFTESTTAVAGSDYGRAKLEIEQILRDGTAAGGWRSFIGRITNLYGPGQDLGKAQGLISVVARTFLTGTPVSIYVSLDTLRDYIFEDDCALVVDAGVRRAAALDVGSVVTKIIGAMTAVSVGAILGEQNRLRRRRSPVILGGGDPRGQSRDLRVRSEVWTDLDGLVSTTFSAGLDAVFRAQLASYARGIN